MGKRVQLTIPEPCHENWDNMKPADKGRFCDSCHKNVVDFTGMSDAQVLAFFNKPSTGSICGRFMKDQLNRDMEIQRKRIPWLKYFFQFSIPAFLVTKSYAQGGPMLIKKDQQVIVKDTVSTCDFFVKGEYVKKPGTILKGRVLGASGEPIYHATISIEKMDYSTVSDGDGYFNLRYENINRKIRLLVSSIGYKKREMKLNLKKMSSSITVTLDPEPVIYAGMVVPYPLKKAKPKTQGLIQMIADTLSRFRIFPNPATPNTSVNIAWKKLPEGYYHLQLLDLSGKNLYHREVWIDDKARLLNLEVPSLAAGNYYLRVTNKETGKGYTEKLMIQ